MKTILSLVLFCLFVLPAPAQKISALPETLTLSNGFLFIIADPGRTNYKATVGTVASNIATLMLSGSFFAPPPFSGVVFNSNGTLRASSGFVFTNGAVGIGTDTPGAGILLDVLGDARVGTLKVWQSAGIANLYVTNTFSLSSGAAAGFVLTSDPNGVGSWVAPGGVVSTNVVSGHTIYLDATFGNDSTAGRDNIARPFLTPSNAVKAMVSGDTLVVRGGTYLMNPGGPTVAGINKKAVVGLTNLSNVRITGEPGSIWQMASRYVNGGMSSHSMLNLVNCTNVVIDGLTFRGFTTNGVVEQDYAIGLFNCSYVTVERCILDDWQDQGISDVSQFCINSHITIRNCVFSDIGGTNFTPGALNDGAAVSVISSNMTCVGNTFLRNIRDFEYCCQAVTSGLLFEDNVSIEVREASMMFLSGAGGLNDGKIVNNRFRGNANNTVLGIARGIIIYSASNLVVRGNDFSGYDAGLTYGFGGTVPGSVFVDVQIIENTFRDLTVFGVYALRDRATAAKLERVSVTGNKFKNINYASVALNANNSRVENNDMVDCNAVNDPGGVIMIGHVSAPATTNSTNITIIGNKIYNRAFAANAATGIVITASSYSNVVWGNEVHRSYAGSVHDAGVGTMLMPLNKIAPGKLIYSDTNSRMAAVTIGSGVAFDGSTGTLTGNGSTQIVTAAFGTITVTNAINVPILNVGTANINFVNLTNGFILTNIAKSAVTVAQGTNVVVVTNTTGGNITYTIHSTATGTNGGGGGGGSSATGFVNQIVFIDSTLTNLTTIKLTGKASPGFGFNPCATCGPGSSYGGFQVYANASERMGLVTFGHPNPASDFATPETALVISNRWNTSTLFKNDSIKLETVEVGGGLSITSTLMRFRVWQDTASSNDVVEIFKTGEIKATGFTATNALATNRLGQTVFDNGLEFSSFSASVLTNILSTVTNLNFANQEFGGVEDIPVYVPGAADGDVCEAAPVAATIGPIIGEFTAFGSNNTVYVRFLATANGQNPAAGNFRVVAKKFR